MFQVVYVHSFNSAKQIVGTLGCHNIMFASQLSGVEVTSHTPVITDIVLMLLETIVFIMQCSMLFGGECEHPGNLYVRI